VVKLLAKNEAGVSIEPKFILAKRKVEEIKEPEEAEEDEQGELETAQPDEGSAEQKQALEKWIEVVLITYGGTRPKACMLPSARSHIRRSTSKACRHRYEGDSTRLALPRSPTIE
jgi:hypothetical protein